MINQQTYLKCIIIYCQQIYKLLQINQKARQSIVSQQNHFMTSIIDFRNARFQGQTKNNLPHGIGIIIDQHFLFCLSEWYQGQITGYCFIVFPDGKVYYGLVKNQEPIGLNTYHLKDRCQIFRNISPNNQSQQISMAVLLPTFKLLLKVEGQTSDSLKIISQISYQQKDLVSLQKHISTITNYKFQDKQLQKFLSVESFLNQTFVLKYNQLLQITYTSLQKNIKQFIVSFKGQSLGIKLQICQKQEDLTSIHNDGHTYVVRSLGYFSQQGILIGFGIKTIDTLIKGKVRQEGIYSLSQTIKRYEENTRPKQCILNITNYFRRGLQFVNTFFDIYYLYQIQQLCLNINFSIKQHQTRRHAQLILQNPKQLSFQQQKNIDFKRRKLGLNSRIFKNQKSKGGIFDQQLQNRTKLFQKSEQQKKKNQALIKAKQQIYRSVSKRKQSGSKTPNKQIVPSELKIIRPILDMAHSQDKYVQSQNKIYNSPLKSKNIQKNTRNLFPTFSNNTEPTTTPNYTSNRTSEKHLRSYNEYSSKNQNQFDDKKQQQIQTKTPTKRYNYLDMIDENNLQKRTDTSKDFKQNNLNIYKNNTQNLYGRQTKVDLQSLHHNKYVKNYVQAEDREDHKYKNYNPHQYLQIKKQPNSLSPYRKNPRISGMIERNQSATQQNYSYHVSPYSGNKYTGESYQYVTEQQKIRQKQRQKEQERQKINKLKQYQEKNKKDPIYANLDLKKLQLYQISNHKQEDDSITSTQKQLIEYYNQKNNVQSRKNKLRDNDDEYLSRRQPKRQHHIYQKSNQLNDSLDNKALIKNDKNTRVSPHKPVTPLKSHPIKQISPFKQKSSANSSNNNTFGGSKNNSYGQLDRFQDIQTGMSSRGIKNMPNQRSPLKAGGTIKSNKKSLFTKNQFQ